MTVKPETARELLDQAAKRIRESGVLIEQAQCLDDDMRDAIGNAYLQLGLLRARFEAFQEAVDRWRS